MLRSGVWEARPGAAARGWYRVTQGRKLLVLAGFAVLTAVAMGGATPATRSRARTRPDPAKPPRPVSPDRSGHHAPIEGRHGPRDSRSEEVQESNGAKGIASPVRGQTGAVHHLRPAAEPGDEGDRVNVVRLVEYLGPISPELALVDPVLAARARALLPDTPGIRVPRSERDEPIPLPIAAPLPPASRSWRAATVLALVAAALAAFGFGVSAAASGDGETSASVDGTVTTRPPVEGEQTPSGPTSTSPATPAPAAAPRFVWAPQDGVDRYRFSLYRGQQLVFEKDVTTAAFELPRAWTFRGRFHELTSGGYRWVVSPYVGAGNRVGPAIVSASYTG
jgi:hypothetical protein